MASISRTRDEWRGLVGDLERSKLTLGAFALQRGVNARTLSWWKSQLRREPRPAAFIDVTVTREPRPFVVHLGSATAVEVPAGFDADDFERLVGVLDARC
jgi:hypothetical protein